MAGVGCWAGLALGEEVQLSFLTAAVLLTSHPGNLLLTTAAHSSCSLALLAALQSKAAMCGCPHTCVRC